MALGQLRYGGSSRSAFCTSCSLGGECGVRVNVSPSYPSPMDTRAAHARYTPPAEVMVVCGVCGCAQQSSATAAVIAANTHDSPSSCCAVRHTSRVFRHATRAAPPCRCVSAAADEARRVRSMVAPHDHVKGRACVAGEGWFGRRLLIRLLASAVDLHETGAPSVRCDSVLLLTRPSDRRAQK